VLNLIDHIKNLEMSGLWYLKFLNIKAIKNYLNLTYQQTIKTHEQP
jgi:hypothetical protein